MVRFGTIAVSLLTTLAVALLAARPPGDAIDLDALARDPAVRSVIESARTAEARVLADQVRLCEVPAPPFGEGPRGVVLSALFEEAGLQRVRTDGAGNVIGERPGRGAGPHLMLTAHLDTVFPEGTDVTVRRDGARWHGPGLADDCRGLAVLVGVARALRAGGIETDGRITFVGTVGEEGLGDLRGVKHLFAGEFREGVDRFISIDGTGFGVTATAVGSLRYRVTFAGPGGHSYSDFGQPNPLHAMGRAVAAIAALEVPSTPRTTFNVGRVGGGTSVNSIAFEGWMEVDLRSSSPEALRALDAGMRRGVDAAVAAENGRWANGPPVTATFDRVGDRPSGRTDPGDPIVRLALETSRMVGKPTALGEGSTDANLPISLGIPAITIGGGGRSDGSHSLQEWFEPGDSWVGTQRAILLALALTAQVAAS